MVRVSLSSDIDHPSASHGRGRPSSVKLTSPSSEKLEVNWPRPPSADCAGRLPKPTRNVADDGAGAGPDLVHRAVPTSTAIKPSVQPAESSGRQVAGRRPWLI